METSSVPATNAVCRERLQQAVRVMQDLATNPRGRRFNIGTFLEEDYEIGPGFLVGCITGFCALDPWFQAQGLTIQLGEPDSPKPSVMPDEFFGTSRPFYADEYGTDDVASITIDDAIAALNSAIGELPPRIVRASIGPTPQALGDRRPKVHAYFDDGTDAEIFEFSPDKISFSESDFVGLTSSEAVTRGTDMSQ